MDRKRQRLNLTPKPNAPITSFIFYSLSIFLPSITPKPNPQFSFSLSISLYISLSLQSHLNLTPKPNPQFSFSPSLYLSLSIYLSISSFNHIQYKSIFWVLKNILECRKNTIGKLMKHEGMSYTNLFRYMDRKRQRLNLTPKPNA